MTNNIKELIEDANIVENNDNSPVEPSKGINLYIDPTGKESTPISLVLGGQGISVEAIRAIGEEYAKLTINGCMDKKGFEAVKAAKNKIVKTRTTILKTAKHDVIDPVNSLLKEYKEAIGSVESECKVWENVLQEKITEAETAYELEQQRKENEAKQLLIDRSTAIAAVGGVYNSDTTLYTFPHDIGLLATDEWLKTWDDIEWQLFISEATESWEIEQTRVTKQKADEEAELARLKSLSDKHDAIVAEQIKSRERELIKFHGGIKHDDDGFILVKGRKVGIDVLKVLTTDEWDVFTEQLENATELPPNVESEVTDDIADANQSVSQMGRFKIVNVADVKNLMDEDDKEWDNHPLTPWIHNNTTVDPNTTFTSDLILGFNEQTELVGVNTASTSEDNTTDDAKHVLNGKVAITANFWAERPYFDHPFSKTIVRFFPSAFEQKATDGVTAIDKGYIEGLGLQYLVIKKQK